MYRCAANYKECGVVVFNGSVTDEEVRAMSRAFDCSNFVAHQIGVPEVFPWVIGSGDYDDEFDHCWHEFCDIGPTDATPTDARTASEFCAQVAAIGMRGWAEFNADPADVAAYS